MQFRHRLMQLAIRHTTTYSYDSFGNRTNQTDALGNVTTYGYDAVGNQISMIDPLSRTQLVKVHIEGAL